MPLPNRHRAPMIVQPEAVSPASLYNFMTRLVTPRPIAWVSSLAAEGTANLAPFSYFNAVGSNPPLLLFCPANRRDGSKKDTLVNVEQTGEFVINVVTEELGEQMNHTSAEFAAEIDEFEACGIALAASQTVKPPRVAAARAAFECRVHSIQHLGCGPLASNLVLGLIKAIHIDDGLLGENGRLQSDALPTIGRLGGPAYCRTSDRFEMPRPDMSE